MSLAYGRALILCELDPALAPDLNWSLRNLITLENEILLNLEQSHEHRRFAVHTEKTEDK